MTIGEYVGTHCAHGFHHCTLGMPRHVHREGALGRSAEWREFPIESGDAVIGHGGNRHARLILGQFHIVLGVNQCELDEPVIVIVIQDGAFYRLVCIVMEG